MTLYCDKEELDLFLNNLRLQMTVKWLSPVEDCDICKTNLNLQPFFYDAKTANGQWGLLCPFCFLLEGCRVGTGRGQKYNTKTKEKVAG